MVKNRPALCFPRYRIAEAVYNMPGPVRVCMESGSVFFRPSNCGLVSKQGSVLAKFSRFNQKDARCCSSVLCIASNMPDKIPSAFQSSGLALYLRVLNLGNKHIHVAFTCDIIHQLRKPSELLPREVQPRLAMQLHDFLWQQAS